MKKIFSVILFIFLFIINVNAEVSVSYDNAVKTSQRYIYKFNKYDKYLLTDKKYIELKGSDTAIIPFGFKNNKLEVNSDFTRGGLLNEEEFNLSKDSNGSTYLSQDVEFFLIGKKAVNTLNNEVIDAGDKKYGIRVTEFVLPGTKTRGSGTKVNPWEFVGTYKLTFYINNGKITNNGLSVNKYIVYAVESTEGQIIVNFEPNSGFEYLRNNCNFTYEYDKTNKIHKIYKDNKDINSDQDCTIDLKTGSFIVEYDYNGGNGKCENLAVPKGNKISKLCTNVSREGYTFKGWQDEKGNTVTNDTVVNGNIKLIAQWEIKKATLTINPNGGIWNNTTSNSTKTGTINSTLSIANPTPKGYTVSFNSNGGNNVNSITSQRTFTNWSLSGSGSMSGTTYTFGSGNATLTANYNNGSITLPSTTAAGYKFKGWYSNGCDTTFIGNAGESYTPTSNVTLKACYHYYAYILDVYPNGGTWNGTTKMTRINPLANPKPSIYGNTDYTGKIYSTIDIPNPIPPSGYTVSFNTNGGSSVGSITSTKSFNGWNNSSPGTFSGTTYTYGEGSGYITANYKNNSVKLPKPTKSGYTFDGWYTASSGGTKVNNTYTPTSNITLYAHWKVNSYTLTINPNGGTWNNTTSNSTKTGTTNSTLSIANPTPKGYTVSFNSNGGNNVNSITSQRTFTNWSLSGSGSMSGTTYTFGSGNATLTANYNNGSITLPSTTAAGYKFKGWYSNGCDTTFIGNAGESYTPTSNVTLKACYHYYAYILDVYPNGGTWNGTTKMTRINPLANPKPSIYGNTDYTGKIYSTIDIPNPIPPSGYTVSFNTNGGSSVGSITSTKSFNGWNNSSPGTFSGTTYTYGEGSGYITANYKNNSVKLPKPTKSGYTFDGWYTASSGGTYVGTSGSYYSPTSNIKLYAHWSSNASTSYTLTVNPNGGIWNGTTSSSSFTASSGSTKIISNPTPPSGYTVSFNANGGNSVSSKTASSSFDYWYKSGAGSLSGTTFTYGSGNTSLTARYTINSITLPSTSKAGYTFNGWYTSSSGGSYVGRSGSSYTPTSNTTLYAHWTDNTSSNITYNISYNLNNGTHGSSHPTSATYGSSVNISNPTKKVTINLSKGTTASGATISSSSVSADQTFDGWTAANLNTTTARYGSSSTSINTQWSKGSTKTKSTYFKNLTSTNNATVTLTANWTQKNITLPKITKTGYTCGWATSSSATTITYASGATYAPNAKGNTSVNLYGVCKSNSAPSLKVTFKTSAGYSDYCTSAHTASNGSCTFDKGYYTPLTLTLEATDENPLTKMTFAYNASDQTSYTDVKYTEDVTFVKSGNTYTGTRTIGSAGKRKIKITATNSIGKTSTVIMNINAVKPPFENKYDCTTSVVSSGTIYSWIAGSDCKSTSESRTEKCSEYNGSEYFGIIDQNKSACVKELNWVSENTVRVNAYVPKSAFKTINGDAYLKYNNYKSETYNGITYYYVTFPVWCNQANCGSSGWVINSEARKKICPSIKTKNSAMYNKICK